MAYDHVLEALERREKSAMRYMQTSRQKYQAAVEATNDVFAIMQEAWQSRCAALDDMLAKNEEIMSRYDDYTRKIWDNYHAFRRETNSEIQSLRASAAYEHRRMSECFTTSRAAYAEGRHKRAQYYSAQARRHQTHRNELNAKVGELVAEIRARKSATIAKAPIAEAEELQAARETFLTRKKQHLELVNRFNWLKKKRDLLHEEYNSRRQEYQKVQAAVRERQEELKHPGGPSPTAVHLTLERL